MLMLTWPMSGAECHPAAAAATSSGHKHLARVISFLTACESLCEAQFSVLRAVRLGQDARFCVCGPAGALRRCDTWTASVSAQTACRGRIAIGLAARGARFAVPARC